MAGLYGGPRMNDTTDNAAAILEHQINEWLLWKERLDFAKAKERALRDNLIAANFPSPKEGTQHLEVQLATKSVKLTLQHPIDRKVDKGAYDALVKAAREDEAHPLHNTNLDKLIRNKPELVVREYKSLDELERIAFGTVLTIKPGSDQFSVTWKAEA